MMELNKQQFVDDLKTQYNENVNIMDIIHYECENDYFVVYMKNMDIYTYNYDDNKIYFDCNDSENGIIGYFVSLYELYDYMNKNGYDKKIMGHISKMMKTTNNHIEYIKLYDDMFTIYYTGHCLKYERFYMDLML